MQHRSGVLTPTTSLLGRSIPWGPYINELAKHLFRGDDFARHPRPGVTSFRDTLWRHKNTPNDKSLHAPGPASTRHDPRLKKGIPFQIILTGKKCKCIHTVDDRALCTLHSKTGWLHLISLGLSCDHPIWEMPKKVLSLLKKPAVYESPDIYLTLTLTMRKFLFFIFNESLLCSRLAKVWDMIMRCDEQKCERYDI